MPGYLGRYLPHGLAAKNAFANPLGVFSRSRFHDDDMNAIRPCDRPFGVRLVGSGSTGSVTGGFAAVPQMYVCFTHGSPNSHGWNCQSGRGMSGNTSENLPGGFSSAHQLSANWQSRQQFRHNCTSRRVRPSKSILNQWRAPARQMHVHDGAANTPQKRWQKSWYRRSVPTFQRLSEICCSPGSYSRSTRMTF